MVGVNKCEEQLKFFKLIMGNFFTNVLGKNTGHSDTTTLHYTTL